MGYFYYNYCFHSVDSCCNSFYEVRYFIRCDLKYAPYFSTKSLFERAFVLVRSLHFLVSSLNLSFVSSGTY